MPSNKFTLALVLFLTIFTYSNAKLGHLKETKLTVYYQDYSSGQNATVIEIPGPSNGTLNFSKFGAMFCTDDPITKEFKEDSTIIARGRGMFVTSALDGSHTHVMFSVVLSMVSIKIARWKYKVLAHSSSNHAIIQSNMTVLHY
ncbi:dirigent protein 22-like [Salvia divinorum]|uniref:Dirigent protein n=1 Tax=Salvia divinorum TaxID=28513 RepID=A0ABD1IFX8_SALDI